MNKLKRTVLATALAVASHTVASPAYAETFALVSYEGWFTMLNDAGTDALVNGDASGQGFYGRRTQVTGTMELSIDTGSGSATMQAFTFFGGGLATATSISFQGIGDGSGGVGSLVLGNMGFNWHATNQIPISVVLDVSGFLAAAQSGLNVGDTISGFGALAATDDFLFDFGKVSYTLPIGPVPIATTTFNTADIGTVGLGSNPSGTLPLTDDGIGGSPMKSGPFPNFNANFDITTLQVNGILIVEDPLVPIPAAVWLFGSGLLGLIGVARRKKTA